MKGRKYYLAYGSNLNIPQMRRRCPNAATCPLCGQAYTGHPARCGAESGRLRRLPGRRAPA